MGCAESREAAISAANEPLLSAFSPDQEGPTEPIPLPTRMGNPQPYAPVTGLSQISTQHERLILELLPFKDARQFHE